MKQTAVEWLIEQVNSENYQKAFGQTYISVVIIDQAKAMEKQQIVDAYLNDRPKAEIDKALRLWDQAEHYYTSTFNS